MVYIEFEHKISYHNCTRTCFHLVVFFTLKTMPVSAQYLLSVFALLFHPIGVCFSVVTGYLPKRGCYCCTQQLAEQS